MIELRKIRRPGEVEEVRTLFLEYAATRENDPALVDFPEEIESLPGFYSPPDGDIILAFLEGRPVGCVAVHRLDEETCEMKRLYVSPSCRKRGIGMRLARAVLSLAGEMGYSRMCLDTIPNMKAAQSLYESMGFYEIADYRNNPNPGTRYFEIEL